MNKFFLFTLLFISLVLASLQGNCQAWFPLGKGVKTVPFGYTVVYCLGVDHYHNYLYVGGDFNHAGPFEDHYIAVWNGQQWLNWEDSIGAITVIPERAIQNYGDTIIYAGGHGLGSVFGFDLDPLCCFNSLNDDINCLYLYKDTLYAGGYFTEGIKKWDGQQWKSVGGGVSGVSAEVESIIQYNGQLVAGGYFTKAGTTVTHSIASFDGTTWHPFGTGVNNSEDYFSGTVTAMEVYRGNLIVSGLFDSADVISANGIATWDGTQWSNPFGYGLIGHANDIYADSSGLYIGGNFITVDSTSMYHITRWDSTGFHALASGLSGEVYAITRFDGNLIAGGTFFTSYTGDTLYRIARFDEGYFTGTFDGTSSQQLIISPNPTTTSIQLHLPSNHSITLTLFNLLGEKVEEQTITGSDITIDVSELPAGMYVVRVGEWSGKPTSVNTTVGKFVKE